MTRLHRAPSVRRASAIVVAAILSGVFGAGTGVAEPPAVPPGCTGGIATNPSVEVTTENRSGAPDGYTVVGPPGATLDTDTAYKYDGKFDAVLATSGDEVSTAYSDIPYVVPGGVYDLTVWAGTHEPALDQPIGLRAYDSDSNLLAEVALQADHDVDGDDELGRLDLPGFTAPDDTASVKFFAATDGDQVAWDCVYLNVAAYNLVEQVQDPATGEWGTSATLPVGATANFRVTVSNMGTHPLSDITVTDSWCEGAPVRSESMLFDLGVAQERTLTCDHPNVEIGDDGRVNVATASIVTYPGGTLPAKASSASIRVQAAPATTPIEAGPVAGPAPELAATGVQVFEATVLALGFLAAGVGLLVLVRRRRKDNRTDAA